jgi:hypothetical protein
MADRTWRHARPQHKDVDPKNSGCVEFKDTLDYFSSGSNRQGPLYYFEVAGTLSNHFANTTATLRPYWTPDHFSEQSELLASTTSTKDVDKARGPNNYGITNIHVLLCAHGGHNGCTPSASLAGS